MKHRSLLVGAAVVLTMLLGSCAKSSEPVGSEQTTSAAIAPNTKYDGPDSKYPSTFGQPVEKPGFKFTVGYISLSESVDIFKVGTGIAKKEVEKLGGNFIVKDGQLDSQKIVSAFDELLAQKVDAIITYPLEPKALGPSLAKAKSLGVPVFGQDVPTNPSEALPPDWTASALNGRDASPFLMAQAGAQQSPGASFAILGYAQSAGALQYEFVRFEYWGKQFGLNYLGRVDGATLAPTDIAAGMQALLARYPDVKLVFMGNDSMASAAAAQARAQGNTKVMTSGLSGTQQGFAGVKSGNLFATYRTPVEKVNTELVWAAYNNLTNQNSPQPKSIVVPGQVVTKANVDALTPSAAR